MSALLVAAVVCMPVGPKPVVRTNVDKIEVNHHYDETTGDKMFTQIIFWKEYKQDGKFHVQHWTMIKERHLPVRRWDRGGWYIFQFSDAAKVFHEVAAPLLIETKTTYDPEIDDREELPQNERLGLNRKPGKKRKMPWQN